MFKIIFVVVTITFDASYKIKCLNTKQIKNHKFVLESTSNKRVLNKLHTTRHIRDMTHKMVDHKTCIMNILQC